MINPLPALVLLPIPDNRRGYPWCTEIEGSRSRLQDPAHCYADANGIRYWMANDACVPPHVYRDAYVECPAAQEAAYSACMDEFLTEYRRKQAEYFRNPDPEIEAERAFEMRAEFGRGVTVVDVFSGHRYRT